MSLDRFPKFTVSVPLNQLNLFAMKRKLEILAQTIRENNWSLFQAKRAYTEQAISAQTFEYLVYNLYHNIDMLVDKLTDLIYSMEDDEKGQ